MSSSGTPFQWYEIVTGSELEQGDFLDDLLILIQPQTMPLTPDEFQNDLPLTLDLDNAIQKFNVVVMTQSCDFNKLKDDDLVTLCPRFQYNSRYKKDQWKQLRQGFHIGAHLLNKCDLDGHQFDYQVVDLTKIFSVTYGYLKRFAEQKQERIRLLSPYREHLAQSFARRFMRVGLPIDLPEDCPY